MGRQHQGMDRPEVRQVPEGSGEQGKMEETGCEIICGAPTTLSVKGRMMMMMMIRPVGIVGCVEDSVLDLARACSCSGNSSFLSACLLFS